VRHLGKVLSENGVKVWIDEAEIKVGDSLIRKISEGIKNMEYLGVVLSPNSVSSSWVQKEVEIAATMEIKKKKLKVLPILYKDCEIPLFLQHKVYADFRNRSMFQHSLIAILDVLLPDGFKESILSAVRNAVKAEFSAYKSLPKVNLEDVDKYFTKEGSARGRIFHLLKRHQKRKWIISNPMNPSTTQILDIRLRKIQDERAYVSTEEYWYLRWYNFNTSKYCFIYNKKNRQIYILVRDTSGNWRVDVNIYPGKEWLG